MVVNNIICNENCCIQLEKFTNYLRLLDPMVYIIQIIVNKRKPLCGDDALLAVIAIYSSYMPYILSVIYSVLMFVKSYSSVPCICD